MPAKSTSPEAAQKKVWLAELRDHKKAAAKVTKDFNAEDRRLAREVSKHRKALRTAINQISKYRKFRPAKESRATRSIETRCAFLRGRLGI